MNFYQGRIIIYKEKMQTVIISDQHGWLPDLPSGDLLLIAGDCCPLGKYDPGFQNDWFRNEFANWLHRQSFTYKVGICGNHEFIGENQEGDDILRCLDWHYLQGEAVEIQGITIWGDPHSPGSRRWAFMDEDTTLEKHYSKIPDYVDILITHGPPYGTGDQVVSGQRVGSKSLQKHLPRIRPSLHTYGHIHEAREVHQIQKAEWSSVSLNASLLDHRFQPWGKCWQLNLEYSDAGWRVDPKSIKEPNLDTTDFPEMPTGKSE